jgi:hypothetical protein
MISSGFLLVWKNIVWIEFPVSALRTAVAEENYKDTTSPFNCFIRQKLL